MPSSSGSFGFSSFESDFVAGIASVSSSKSAFRTLLLLNGFDDGLGSLVVSALASSLFVVLEIFAESSSLGASEVVAIGLFSTCSIVASDEVAT